MKKWMILVGILGMGYAWGHFGAEQVKKADYDCQIRLESLCFMWEKSHAGKARDDVMGHVERDTGGQ